ncbi:MAG: DNA replication/repair protein RecF [Bacillota bacterium]|uniref:DNA replication/repair protein RecF n=1 Tax=Thermanaerosceptrum fracticalcis TaxID=1712410 RepID=UPI000552EEF1|nr:DNA replication/repair protein RecF [Thermanaerosceptrum fracticalcis]
MYLERLGLTNYRNYETLNEDFSAQLNILSGPNAQGKTNLLEAIYYLATGKTYRPARDLQLIRWNHQAFSIQGKIRNKQGYVTLEVLYKIGEQNSKEIKVNGLKIYKTSELLGNLTAVLFAPEDLNIIKGSPLERRKILDNDISQVSPGYFLKLQQYNRVLNQRNYLLKKIRERGKGFDELEIWNEQFLELSESIILKRINVLEKLSPLTRLMQRKLTNGQENLEIRYLFSRQKELKLNHDLKKVLLEELEKYRGEEIKKGISLWGPHRDDLLISLNGNDLKVYGSQGQHRTAVLALKLSELEFFKAESGEFPVLLLDDVLSELDQERRGFLLNIIKEKKIQCFITTTEDIALENDRITIQKFLIRQGTLIKCRGGK